MARNPREDEPGSWHHVMNRGIARRSLFETGQDMRCFLAQLARAVRRGQIEVHAWCVLTTHYHLLVRSPVGELSAAMRRVQNSYVRSFNRGRRRDGPMVRGRFRSKAVKSLAYRVLVVRYIDQNPVRAGLAREPWDYPWGSARSYLQGSGPPWLSRDWVESIVCRRLDADLYDGALYARAFASAGPSTAHLLVEERLERSNRSGTVPDPLDDLLAGVPGRVLAWMRRKAQLADGTDPGEPVVDPATAQGCVAVARTTAPSWTVHLGRRVRCGWDVLEVGLLRDLTCASLPQIAARTGGYTVGAARLYEEHRELLCGDPAYAARATECADAALAELRGLVAPASRMGR